MATRKHANPLERERHLAVVSRMYLQGMLQSEIAFRLEVTQQQVSYDLKLLQKRWQESALRNVDAIKAEQLAKIDEIEREAWAAWDRSKEDKETTIIEQQGARGNEETDAELPEEGGGEGDTPRPRLKTKEKREGQTGNPAHMADIQWCIEQRCRILGLDAPKRQEHSGPGGQPLQVSAVTTVVDTAQLMAQLRKMLETGTPEERAALIKGYETLSSSVETLMPLLTAGRVAGDAQEGEE